MKKLILGLAFLACAVGCRVVQAQTGPTLTFTAQTTVGNGSLVPVLTWSTTPAASACTASGDPAWTGTKASSGTATLSAISTSKTYNLTCSWNDQRATVRWTPATQNEDGSNYTDPKNILVYFSTNADPVSGGPSNSPVTLPPTATQTIIGPLPPGTWRFAAKSVNQSDVQSDLSNVAEKVITASVVDRNVAITINPVPNPPTNLTVE